MEDEVRDKMFDDLFCFGICASKTEIIDGKVHIKYVDPMSDELRNAMYNAEHEDSKMKTYNILKSDDCFNE